MDREMSSPWERIDDFRSLGEFEHFLSWMQQQLNDGTAQEVPVRSHYIGANFSEKWFRHVGSGEVWRLVWPDIPFTGVFERVD